MKQKLKAPFDKAAPQSASPLWATWLVSILGPAAPAIAARPAAKIKDQSPV